MRDLTVIGSVIHKSRPVKHTSTSITGALVAWRPVRAVGCFWCLFWRPVKSVGAVVIGSESVLFFLLTIIQTKFTTKTTKRFTGTVSPSCKARTSIEGNRL